MIAKMLALSIGALALLAAMSGWAEESHEGLVQFEGRWLEPAAAAQQEEYRYRRQRVATALEVSVALNADQLRTLRARRNLAAELMAILRVGDRVLIQRGNQQWRVWKRHHNLTREFRQEVDALRAGVAQTDDWAGDPVGSAKLKAVGEDLLCDAAFLLHARRNAFPLADLAAEQLPATGLVVKRNAEDGALTVLAYGAGNFKAETGAIAQVDRLAVVSVLLGDDPLKFTWTSPPQRILVVSDRAVKLLPPAENVALLKNEKRIVRLSDAGSVTAMQRYSLGPEYKGWQQQSFVTGGPLDFEVDLSRDEVGPQKKPGEYRRVWILEFGGIQGKVSTQRQLGMNYRVTNEDKEAESSEFLRR